MDCELLWVLTDQPREPGMFDAASVLVLFGYRSVVPGVLECWFCLKRVEVAVYKKAEGRVQKLDEAGETGELSVEEILNAE